MKKACEKMLGIYLKNLLNLFVVQWQIYPGQPSIVSSWLFLWVLWGIPNFVHALRIDLMVKLGQDWKLVNGFNQVVKASDELNEQGSKGGKGECGGAVQCPHPRQAVTAAATLFFKGVHLSGRPWMKSFHLFPHRLMVRVSRRRWRRERERKRKSRRGGIV